MRTNVTRIQFDLPDSKVEELEKLMLAAGIHTKRELFNNALSLLEWAIRQRKEGRVIASINESSKSYRELSTPILDNTAPDAASSDG
jgi:putative intracellular protease/amidase